MADNFNRFLRLNAVLDRTGLSRSTLYRKIEEGTFPKQITIGIRCVAWLESDVENWMRNPMFYDVDEQLQMARVATDEGLEDAQQVACPMSINTDWPH